MSRREVEGLPSREAEFDVAELVDLAKSVFTDTDSLRALEKAAALQKSMSPARFYQECDAIPVWTKAHAIGRFTQMCRLHPISTDEAIENRINRAIRRVHEHAPVSSGKHSGHIFRSPIRNSPHSLDLPLPELLGQLASTFLCEGRDGSIRVRSKLLQPWQELILVVPPLLVTAAFIAERVPLEQLHTSTFTHQRSLADRLARWLCDSTLPVDDDPFLDHLSSAEGLDETHLHLNGTTEAEKVWCDALERPQQVVGRLTARVLQRDSGLRIPTGNGVARLLRQEDLDLTPDKLMQRTLDAIGLKASLLSDFVNPQVGMTAHRRLSGDEAVVTDYRNVLMTLLPEVNGMSRVAREAWQLALIYHGITSGRTGIGGQVALWHYSLVRAQFCRLLIQQASQKGFDQFQYITLNELREETERTYAERFRQIERGHQRGVAYLEGRFAPKGSPDDTAELLGRVLRGYFEFLAEDELSQRPQSRRVSSYHSLAELLALIRRHESDASAQASSRPIAGDIPWVTRRRLRLGLVPHFIKQSTAEDHASFFKPQGIRPICRELKLRIETERRARALVVLLEKTPGLNTLIRGVDAASNERHAGPEVFAPTYRRMRNAGIRRFTYHAGEDFAHLASGLRAITEAVMFLELGAGCRIGHGTASGLSPKKWWKAMGAAVVMPAEDRLDDLVVARELFLTEGMATERLPLIEAEIHRLAMGIWNDPRITVEVLTAAWKMRSLDPTVSVKHIRDVDRLRRDEALRHQTVSHLNPAGYKHFLRRHGIGADQDELLKARKDVVISLDSDVLRPRDLRLMQHAVLKLLHERRIAIETLPSSNVRISIHGAYESHHAGYWLAVGKKRSPVPVSVVVGTDDPGIFATALRTEYSHLLRMLKSRTTPQGQNVEDVIRRVCLEAKQYRF